MPRVPAPATNLYAKWREQLGLAATLHEDRQAPPERLLQAVWYHQRLRREQLGYLTNTATGAAYPAVTAATFEKAELLIPPAPLLKQFGEATIPMAEQIHNPQRQIRNLRRTRDLLLPRLLSGQVSINSNDL